MPKFRKKPVVIEAEQFSDEFVTKYHGTAHLTGISFHHDYALIQTLEGSMRADRGDWIITGVKGERYPCKPDIFAETYEPVEEPETVDPSLADAAARAVVLGSAVPTRWGTESHSPMRTRELETLLVAAERKIANLQNTVGTLISWMAQSANSPISRDEARQLLALLEKK